MSEKEEKVYSINDLIEILQVSRKTILNLIKKGELVGFSIGGRYRVTQRALDNYIEKTRVQPKKK